ncbi:MAG: hypothetical protein ACYT04_000000101485, partial [Nostoc sp.]
LEVPSSEPEVPSSKLEVPSSEAQVPSSESQLQRQGKQGKRLLTHLQCFIPHFPMPITGNFFTAP